MATCEVKPGQVSHSFDLSFDVDATSVVRAVWCERNNRILRGLREGEITQFDEAIALFNPDNTARIITVTPDIVVAEIEEFGTKTEPVACELADSGIPDHDNDAPSRRMQLGTKALLLAAQISEQIPSIMPRVEEIAGLNTVLALEIGPETHALAVHLDTGQAA